MSPRFLAVLLFIPAFASADAGQANFLVQRALDPIKFQTGLPDAASRLTTTNALQLSVVHSNVFMGGRSGEELLILDGETTQLNVRYRRQINPCLQINVNSVWLSHTKGWFDKPVDRWHQLFGLPDANRGEWPANDLQYSYVMGEREQTLVDAVNGWGDTQLQVQHTLGCKPESTILRAGLKLPMGKPSEFRGNDGVDSFIDIQSPWKQPSPSSQWHWAGSIGVLATGRSRLPVEQKPVIGFGVLGLNYFFNSRVHMLAQIDWHTSMFNSELRELVDIGAQFSLGLRYVSRNGSQWEVSFSEDAAIDTAPDIAVRLSWVARFDTWPRLK